MNNKTKPGCFNQFVLNVQMCATSRNMSLLNNRAMLLVRVEAVESNDWRKQLLKQSERWSGGPQGNLQAISGAPSKSIKYPNKRKIMWLPFALPSWP